MKKKDNDNRILYFLQLAYEINLSDLNRTGLYKKRRELMKYIDNDLMEIVKVHYEGNAIRQARKDYGIDVVDEALLVDLLEIQKGFKRFFDDHFLMVLRQNWERAPVPKFGKHKNIPAPKEAIRALLPTNNDEYAYMELIISQEDIGTQQLCRILSEGFSVSRFYKCDECHKWKINHKKERTDWLCSNCRKKIYDRSFREKEDPMIKNLRVKKYREKKKAQASTLEATKVT